MIMRQRRKTARLIAHLLAAAALRFDMEKDYLFGGGLLPNIFRDENLPDRRLVKEELRKLADSLERRVEKYVGVPKAQWPEYLLRNRPINGAK